MKRLHLSKEDSMISGVCGGIAETTGIDPVIIRFGFVAALFLTVDTLLVYFVLWFIMPEIEND